MAVRKVPTLLETMDSAELSRFVGNNYVNALAIAHAMCGRLDPAKGVAKLVVSRGMRLLDTWVDESQGTAYFLHHAILVARRATKIPKPTADDLLLASPLANDPDYQASLRAIRTLPRQQMEAFILAAGASLNSRWIGVAMDCSATAAETHLTAARSDMRTLTGEKFDPLVRALNTAYRSFTVAQNETFTIGRTLVRRRNFRRRLGLIVSLLVCGAIIVGLVIAIKWIMKTVELA